MQAKIAPDGTLLLKVPADNPRYRQLVESLLGDDDQPHDTKDLAELYAEMWHRTHPYDVGHHELATAHAELHGGTHGVNWDGDKWHVSAPPRSVVESVLLEEVRHAPKGEGITIKGKHFKPGQFIPLDAYKQATPDQKAAIDKPAEAAASARKARGSVDHDKLIAALVPHAHHELTAKEKLSAKRSFNALHRHHGDLVVHRLEEIAAELQKAHDREGNTEGQTEQYSRRLRAVQHQIEMAKDKGLHGDLRQHERVTAEEHPGDGSIVEDGSGKQFVVIKSRHGLVTAAPIIDGKAKFDNVNVQQFVVGENRGEPVTKLYKTGRNYHEEQEAKKKANGPHEMTAKEWGEARHKEDMNDDYRKAAAPLLKEAWEKGNATGNDDVKTLTPKQVERLFDKHSESIPGRPLAGSVARGDFGASSMYGGEYWLSQTPGGSYMVVKNNKDFGPNLAHKREVEKAIAAGKPVPPEVLADYPDLQPKGKKPPEKPKQDNNIVREIGSLSSGTLARLFGTGNMAEIDQKAADWQQWAAAQPGKFETWQDAWEAYKPVLDAKVKANVSQTDEEAYAVATAKNLAEMKADPGFKGHEKDPGSLNYNVVLKSLADVMNRDKIRTTTGDLASRWHYPLASYTPSDDFGKVVKGMSHVAAAELNDEAGPYEVRSAFLNSSENTYDKTADQLTRRLNELGKQFQVVNDHARSLELKANDLAALGVKSDLPQQLHEKAKNLRDRVALKEHNLNTEITRQAEVEQKAAEAAERASQFRSDMSGVKIPKVNASKLIKMVSNGNMLPTAAATGYATDGRFVVKLNGKDKSKFEEEAKKVGDKGGRKLSEVQVSRPLSEKHNEPAKIVGVRETDDAPAPVYLMQGEGKQQALVDSRFHQAILSQYPDAVPHMPVKDGGIVIYKNGGEPVGAVVSLENDRAWKGNYKVDDTPYNAPPLTPNEQGLKDLTDKAKPTHKGVAFTRDGKDVIGDSFGQFGITQLKDDDGKPEGWGVVHIPSGSSVGSYDTKRDASFAAIVTQAGGKDSWQFTDPKEITAGQRKYGKKVRELVDNGEYAKLASLLRGEAEPDEAPTEEKPAEQPPATSVPVEPEKPKEPWEMTLKEYKDAVPGNGRQDHVTAVIKAIDEGKPVPDSVVSLYADTVRASVMKSLREKYGDNFQGNLKELADKAGSIHDIVADHGDGNYTVRRKQSGPRNFVDHVKGEYVSTKDGIKVISKAGVPYVGRGSAGVSGYMQKVTLRDPKKNELEEGRRAIAAKEAIEHGGEPRNMDYPDLKKKQMAEYSSLVDAALGGNGDTDASAEPQDPIKPSVEPASHQQMNALAKEQAYQANLIRKRQGLASLDFELKEMPVSAIKPSQSGEDYYNPSSRELSKHIGQFMASGRKEDYAPAAVDENMKIIDGNHRHAARVMAGIKTMPVLVPKGVEPSPAPNYANAVTIAADSVGELRKQDVHRVMDSMQDADTLKGMGEYITANRPDLQGAVDEAAGEIAEERGYGKKETAKDFGLSKPIGEYTKSEMMQELGRRVGKLSDEDLSDAGFSPGSIRVNSNGKVERYIGQSNGNQQWMTYNLTDTTGELQRLLKATNLPPAQEMIGNLKDSVSHQEPEDKFETQKEYVGDATGDIAKERRKFHREMVSDALAAGNPVPPEVLADYPDLAAKYGKPADVVGDTAPVEPPSMSASVQAITPEKVTLDELARRKEEDAGSAIKPAAVIGDVATVEPPAPDPETEPTGPMGEVPEPSPDTDPRQLAEDADKALKSDYEFARSSAIPNMGEDLKGSARHKVNAWKGIEQAEKDGTAESLMTRDNLLKNEPPDLLAKVTPANALSALASHLAMSSFPAIPYDGKSLKSYLHSAGQKTPEELRKQYYDAYQKIKDEAERLASSEVDPRKTTESLCNTVQSIIKGIRNTGKKNQYGVELRDSYNPVANGLCTLGKRLFVGYRSGKNDVISRVHDFSSRLKEAYGDTPTEDMLSKAAEHVKDVMEGDSFNKTFGTVKGGKKGFDPASLYVKHANRRGGRVIDAATVDAGKDFMMNDLKMRGLQWGNSVTDSERQHHLQKSSEALADLADVLGLPDHAISLGSSLGLAIGARGHGSALAHYEPGKSNDPNSRVINLTRKNGVGSLAHEWGHALDHYLTGGKISSNGEKTGGDYMSNRTSARRVEKDVNGNYYKDENGRIKHFDNSTDPVWAAMNDVRKAMKESGFDNRLIGSLNKAIRDGEMSKDKAANYWNSGHEKFARAFEVYVKHKLTTQGRENTYLSGVNDHAFWPNAEEVAKIEPSMNNLMEAVRKKHFGDDGAGSVIESLEQENVLFAFPPSDAGSGKSGPLVHEFASTQFNLADDADVSQASKARAMAARIADADLAEGRESEPHVTVLYGLHGQDPVEVAEVVRDFGPVTVRFGATSAFPGEDHDVVIVQVFGDDIYRLNNLLRDSLEHTEMHSQYVPHVTLAYVKPGLGEKYAGMMDLFREEATFGELVFSDKEGEQFPISLLPEEEHADVSESLESDRPSDVGPFIVHQFGKQWKITHAGTGLGTLTAHDKGTAVLAAKVMGAKGDWSFADPKGFGGEARKHGRAVMRAVMEGNEGELQRMARELGV